jgi:hypothetical protein
MTVTAQDQRAPAKLPTHAGSLSSVFAVKSSGVNDQGHSWPPVLGGHMEMGHSRGLHDQPHGGQAVLLLPLFASIPRREQGFLTG